MVSLQKFWHCDVRTNLENMEIYWVIDGKSFLTGYLGFRFERLYEISRSCSEAEHKL